MTESRTTTTSSAHEGRVVVYVWIALAAITVLAWRLTPGHTGEAASLDHGLVAVIVVLGLIKCRLIIRYFMEVRRAPRWLRVGTDVWLVLLWGGLLGIYLWT